MSTFLLVLTLLSMFAVLVVLGAGVYSLYRGGKFGERWSNKLMQWRVMLQAVAIGLLCLFAWWKAGH
ncbi:twin transmembrane helix small protein [Asticcacaulis sp. AND118]|uniref:twin transmembrane helix small protein n=1 Tax=Asticcacaulis sp. AND118 TaxID=2840468 RepID=UPI001CFFA019|nr:twin transmembrane helix small protein [Asticcacaulis sp. AND118]UDF03852.1 twin transmembrane helix small protein [Asticcacaulis sp. AND118]